MKKLTEARASMKTRLANSKKFVDASDILDGLRVQLGSLVNREMRAADCLLGVQRVDEIAATLNKTIEEAICPIVLDLLRDAERALADAPSPSLLSEEGA